MPTIERFQSHLKHHPIAAIAVIGLLAFAFPMLAAAALVALALLVGPDLVRRARSPEHAIERLEESARAQSLRTIQTASAMGADGREMERAASREAFHARQWEERATKAALRGDDEEAKACLARRRSHLEAHAVIQAELERQALAVATMHTEVDRQRAELAPSGSGGKLVFLAARARRAEARKGLALDRVGVSDAARTAAAVQRAEDEADELERLADRKDPLAAKYEREEADEQAVRDLEELKRRAGLTRPKLGEKVG